MKIVDDRDMKDALRKFKELPAWCVFEVSDCVRNFNGYR